MYKGGIGSSLGGCRKIKGNLTSDVFERSTSTGSVLFALFSRDFCTHKRKDTKQYNRFGSVKAYCKKKGSLPVDMRPSKTSLLKLPKDGDSG